MTPFFSVILPTYNRAHFISKAINSILAQTFTDWELIVVDDGSADNTKEVVENFRNQKIKYVYQNNSERSVARNNGIAHSQGKYICFLDSDDYYLSNHLQNLYNTIKASAFAEAVFIADVVREENGVFKEVAHEDIFNHRNNVCYILCSNETVIPARVCIPVSILSQYKFTTPSIPSEDAELLTRIGAKYPFIEVLSHTVVYHLHEDNSTKRANNPFAGQLVGLKMIFSNPDLKPFIPWAIKKWKLSNCYYGIAQYYEYKQQYRKMIWTLLKSLLLNLSSPTSKAKIYLIIKHLPYLFK